MDNSYTSELRNVEVNSLDNKVQEAESDEKVVFPLTSLFLFWLCCKTVWHGVSWSILILMMWKVSKYLVLSYCWVSRVMHVLGDYVLKCLQIYESSYVVSFDNSIPIVSFLYILRNFLFPSVAKIERFERVNIYHVAEYQNMKHNYMFFRLINLWSLLVWVIDINHFFLSININFYRSKIIYKYSGLTQTKQEQKIY